MPNARPAVRPTHPSSTTTMTLLSTRVDVRRVIGLRDQAGQPVTVTGHQFRHTLGTRLINSGVPQHVVQKLPGHASRHMIAHYARSTTPPSARRSTVTSASGSTLPGRPSATTRTRESPLPTGRPGRTTTESMTPRAFRALVRRHEGEHFC